MKTNDFHSSIIPTHSATFQKRKTMHKKRTNTGKHWKKKRKERKLIHRVLCVSTCVKSHRRRTSVTGPALGHFHTSGCHKKSNFSVFILLFFFFFSFAFLSWLLAFRPPVSDMQLPRYEVHGNVLFIFAQLWAEGRSSFFTILDRHVN